MLLDVVGFSVNLLDLDPVIVELIEKANALGFTTTDEVLISLPIAKALM
jgi:hypothetical protein